MSKLSKRLAKLTRWSCIICCVSLVKTVCAQQCTIFLHSPYCKSYNVSIPGVLGVPAAVCSTWATYVYSSPTGPGIGLMNLTVAEWAACPGGGSVGYAVDQVASTSKNTSQTITGDGSATVDLTGVALHQGHVTDFCMRGVVQDYDYYDPLACLPGVIPPSSHPSYFSPNECDSSAPCAGATCGASGWDSSTCNQGCAADSDCAGGLLCLGGQCGCGNSCDDPTCPGFDNGCSNIDCSNSCNDPSCGGYDLCSCDPGNPACPGDLCNSDCDSNCSNYNVCDSNCSNYDLCSCDPGNAQCQPQCDPTSYDVCDPNACVYNEANCYFECECLGNCGSAVGPVGGSDLDADPNMNWVGPKISPNTVHPMCDVVLPSLPPQIQRSTDAPVTVAFLSINESHTGGSL
jgi:hypothetical protein